MSDPRDPDDPKGLIREAYNIDGISDAECRSILIDWALSLPAGAGQTSAAARLLLRKGQPGHPMTALLAAAADPAADPATAPARRGGRAGRFQRTGQDGAQG